MIIRRELLKAAALVTDATHARHSLENVQVHPDGMVEATNGHVLVQLRDTTPHADADFPTVPVEMTPVVAPILVPATVVTRLIAAMPKRSKLPILTCVRIGQSDTGPVAAATDLEIPVVVNLTAANDAHSYPATDRVIVKDGQREVIKLALSVQVLESMVKIAKTIGTPGGTNVIVFEVPTDPKHRTLDKSGASITDSVKFTTGSDGISADGVVMPCRT